MKKILISTSLLIPFALLGQQNVNSGAGSWSGLLVAAACQGQPSTAGITPGIHRSTEGESGMPRKTPGSTVEKNTTYEQTQNQADRPHSAEVRDRMARTTDRGTPVAEAADDSLARTTTPPIDDKGTRGKATINNTAAKDAANRSQGDGVSDTDTAKGMDASCRIGQTTSVFALRLADGSLLKFDDASNTKIAQQIQSGDRIQKHKTKIFRAKVKGSMQSGSISADSIQM